GDDQFDRHEMVNMRCCAFLGPLTLILSQGWGRKKSSARSPDFQRQTASERIPEPELCRGAGGEGFAFASPHKFESDRTGTPSQHWMSFTAKAMRLPP